ncbi:MAG: hypothetical protein AAFX65_03685 [Cyanobacteria bacterium J06638_7]
MNDTQPGRAPDPADLIPPEEIFSVLRVDPDGTAQLLDPHLRHSDDSAGTAFWCQPNLSLQVGQRVQGILEFHPQEAVAHKRMPHFTVNVVLPEGS